MIIIPVKYASQIRRTESPKATRISLLPSSQISLRLLGIPITAPTHRIDRRFIKVHATLRTPKYFSSSDEPPEHREEEISYQNHRDVVHIVCFDGHNRRETEEYRGKDGPTKAVRG
jgi:hypothetical protein